MREDTFNPPADKVLLERLRREGANSASLGELLGKYRDYLHRVVDLRLDDRLRCRLDPSDIIQEACLEASQRIDNYLRSPPMPFRLWLRQRAIDRLAVLHRCHLHTECRAADRERPLPERSSLLLANALLKDDSPSQWLAKKEQADLIRDAIARLDPPDTEIIQLRLLEEMSNTDAARVLDLSEAAAKKRYTRAILRLKQVLRELTTGGSVP